MAIVPWPLVSWKELVRAFKPGTDDARSAPRRTLRDNLWVTKGINVPGRAGAHASGSVTFFSSLNLDAARAARRGDKAGALRIARAAAKLEASLAFGQIAAQLEGIESITARSAVEGVLTQGASELLERLLIAAATELEVLRRELQGGSVSGTEVFGKVSRVDESIVELKKADGSKVQVARELAQSAHRDELNDCLAVFSEFGERQLIVSACPALETSGAAPRRVFNPFERTAKPWPLTEKSIELLSRPRKARRLLFPVTIEE